MTERGYRRFEDPALQTEFRELLDKGRIAYDVDSVGGILFQQPAASAVGATFLHVLNRQFDGYFVSWATKEYSSRFRALLLDNGLPFVVVEHDEHGISFFVRKGDRGALDRLLVQVTGSHRQQST